MGDRRMTEIRTKAGSLYVYTHWDGRSFPDMARAAVLAAKPRWNDTSYATRIIVDQLTKQGRDQEYGYGLLLVPAAEDSYNANEPSIIIDLVNQAITVFDRGRKTFTSFTALSDDNLAQERKDALARVLDTGYQQNGRRGL